MPLPPLGGTGPAQGTTTEGKTDGGETNYIAAADTNGDGTVSAEELAAYHGSGETAAMSSAVGGQESIIAAFRGALPPSQSQSHGAGDIGFSKDGLVSQLEELGSTGMESRRANLLSSLVRNFDEADSDGDGRINRMEEHSYDRSSRDTNVSSPDGNTVMNMVQMLRAYVVGDGVTFHVVAWPAWANVARFGHAGYSARTVFGQGPTLAGINELTFAVEGFDGAYGVRMPVLILQLSDLLQGGGINFTAENVLIEIIDR